MVTVDRALLEAALFGYERQREEIEAKIAEIRQHIGNESRADSTSEPGKKRVMNAAARRRIAEAQKKRWAEYKNAQGTPVKEAKGKKRVLSAAARKHIAEATRKRWIEYRAAKAANQKSSAKTGRKKKSAAQAATADTVV
ncbi:MAG TPA: hypothetical protein VGH38_16925 [Bryobacteraceae bacterium]|jgi:hypothetical protein